MSERGNLSISITLSPSQVDQVLRAAAGERASGVAAVIATALAEQAGRTDGQPNRRGTRARKGDGGPRRAGPRGGFMPLDTTDRRLSRSLLRGLAILTCFDTGRPERGVLELARELGLSPSTTHRYILTLLELGLLERSARTRKYRLPAPPAL
jgi:hypothetical protein